MLIPRSVVETLGSNDKRKTIAYDFSVLYKKQRFSDLRNLKPLDSES
jgi:hypothetical protein